MTTRRLAAILAADVAGFSAMMERDEEGTAARIRALRADVIEPALARHHGRLVKTTGDGFLAEFASPVEAVRSALTIQDQLAAADLRLRIGINLGDIIIEDDGDVFGDGVNIAARLEQLADPGGICVSGKIQAEVEGKIDRSFEDRGEQQVKNIARHVRVFALAGARTSTEPHSNALPLPDKPSIAVLPFMNMSGDPEQEYFADGVVEDIITALSRVPWLFVIARNSSFVFKGRPIDIKHVGRTLGVRYVLEGSVRKAANRVRITGQLIEAATGAHIWADRFDGNLEDVFELQDRITRDIVNAVAPKLQRAEIERSRSKPTESLTAYDHYLRGMSLAHEETASAVQEALEHFRLAIRADPSFSWAYGIASWCHVVLKANGWSQDPVAERAEALRFVKGVEQSGADDAVALSFAAFTVAYVANDLDRASALVDRALLLNTDHFAVWYCCARCKIYEGEAAQAMEYLRRSMMLNPLDPLMLRAEQAMAIANFIAGDYRAAIDWGERCVRRRPYAVAYSTLAAAHALAGDLANARRAMAQFRAMDVQRRLSNLRGHPPFRREDHFQRYYEGMRLAGLPE